MSTDTPNNENEVNEPGLNYQPMKKTLTFFKSFEEMNEADAKEAAKMDPLENLKNATAMIQAIYKDELKKEMVLRITFSKHPLED